MPKSTRQSSKEKKRDKERKRKLKNKWKSAKKEKSGVHYWLVSECIYSGCFAWKFEHVRRVTVYIYPVVRGLRPSTQGQTAGPRKWKWVKKKNVSKMESIYIEEWLQLAGQDTQSHCSGHISISKSLIYKHFSLVSGHFTSFLRPSFYTLLFSWVRRFCSDKH